MTDVLLTFIKGVEISFRQESGVPETFQGVNDLTGFLVAARRTLTDLI